MTAFRKLGSDHLYSVEYTDGDVEEMDHEEYNFAHALWLREEGWEVEEGELPAHDVAGAVGDGSAEGPTKKTKKKVNLSQSALHEIALTKFPICLQGKREGDSTEACKAARHS